MDQRLLVVLNVVPHSANADVWQPVLEAFAVWRCFAVLLGPRQLQALAATASEGSLSGIISILMNPPLQGQVSGAVTMESAVLQAALEPRAWFVYAPHGAAWHAHLNARVAGVSPWRFAERPAPMPSDVVLEWQTTEQLVDLMHRCLQQWAALPGIHRWVPLAQGAPHDPTELLRLRRQLEECEARLASLGHSPPPGTEHLARDLEPVTISYTYEMARRNLTLRTTQLSGERDVTWRALFQAIAPQLIVEGSDATIAAAMATLVATAPIQIEAVLADVQNTEPATVRITDRSVYAVIVQFRALGLIAPSTRRHSVRDANRYWSLTPYGDAYMSRVLAATTTRPPASSA